MPYFEPYSLLCFYEYGIITHTDRDNECHTKIQTQFNWQISEVSPKKRELQWSLKNINTFFMGLLFWQPETLARSIASSREARPSRLLGHRCWLLFSSTRRTSRWSSRWVPRQAGRVPSSKMYCMFFSVHWMSRFLGVTSLNNTPLIPFIICQLNWVWLLVWHLLSAIS